MIIAVITTDPLLLMATEFPDDPEVDLGFRDPATENSTPEIAGDSKPQMELRVDYEPRISKQRLSNPWWSLRVTIVLFLSALGGLVSSIFLFERAERPSIFKRWKPAPYIAIAAKTMEEPTTTLNWNFRLDQLPEVRIEGDVGGLPMISQAPDHPILPVQEREPFDVAVRLPSGAASLAGPRGLTEASEMVGSQGIGSESAAQTRSTVRTTAVTTRKRQIARFKRRVARRVARSAKSIASFWSIWSRHFFLTSGLASASSQRVVARRSLRRKTKASLSFPLSWHAVAGRPTKKAIPAGAAVHSQSKAGRRLRAP
jgi:hypothetical protein